METVNGLMQPSASTPRSSTTGLTVDLHRLPDQRHLGALVAGTLFVNGPARNVRARKPATAIPTSTELSLRRLRRPLRIPARLQVPTTSGPTEESGEDRVQRVPDVDHAAGVGDVVACGDRRVAVAEDVSGGVQPLAVGDQGAHGAT